MNDDPNTLRPATTDELKMALAYGLRFTTSGKPHRHASDSMADIAAETLVQHLQRSGFVVMKKPPAGAPSTTTGAEGAGSGWSADALIRVNVCF